MTTTARQAALSEAVLVNHCQTTGHAHLQQPGWVEWAIGQVRLHLQGDFFSFIRLTPLRFTQIVITQGYG